MTGPSPRSGGRHSRPAAPDNHGHGHSHSHSHGGPVPPASESTRRLLIALLAPFVLLTLAGLVVLFPTGPAPEGKLDSGTPTDATITAVSTGACPAANGVNVDTGDPDAPQCLTIDIRLDEGQAQGTTIRKVNPVNPTAPRYAAGDPVVLAFLGGDPTIESAYQIKDFQRGGSLLLLAGLFAVAVVLLSRWQGVRALAALGITFGVLTIFILPAILAGENPLLVAIVAAGLIMFATLYLTHGFSARTSVAVLGTLISLVMIGIISVIFSTVTRATGLDEPTQQLIGQNLGIDARGLLLAGVVIGALGVLDDVTVTQASAVWELRRANPTLTRRQLYSSALRIGRDHVAAAVNTLVLAYAGAALPVLLLSTISGVGFGTIVGSQDIAQEILRTLAGSIGIIAAVPVTTLTAALIVSRERV